MLSGTFNISATTAKLCSSSLTLSSMIDGIYRTSLSADIVTTAEPKSKPGVCERERRLQDNNLPYQYTSHIDTLCSEVSMIVSAIGEHRA